MYIVIPNCNPSLLETEERYASMRLKFNDMLKFLINSRLQIYVM